MDWFNKWLDTLYNTFIVSNRYMTLVEGLIKTIEITLGALLIGVVIGTFVAIVKVFCENNKKFKIFDVLCNIYLTVIRGTPVVVQLLIMFFIVFVSAEDGTWVATLTFGINSGAYVAETIRSGILAIDKGQMEAGRSLGFSQAKTMWFIILPQAFKNILPAIGNEMIALLKETSVAGYVAVIDLTKAGNQIKNTTYDQINPILLVAIIYLAMVLFMTKLLNILERRLRKSER
ncbi:MAG: amino acid ABC transporter permease [Clostridia bacterium]|nr:amino acid ABC transporter permease [Clostridia bacterium]MBO7289223.1 amino acid ABC transporter permease [Clostridia bacterium]